MVDRHVLFRAVKSVVIVHEVNFSTSLVNLSECYLDAPI